MGSTSPITLKMSDSSLSTSTSNPQSSESVSLFGDGACGEPLTDQHLVVDFTPVEELDNDFVQRKCCAFWDFMNSQPDLQELMAFPESNLYRKDVEESEESPEEEPLDVPKPVQRERTAVSMLEIVENKGLIDRIFEAKLPQSQCSLGSREYLEDHKNPAFERASSHQETACMCICSGSCNICAQRPSEVSAPSSPRVADLCKTMQEWDSQHPKRMEPPGHPPSLSRSVMQRNVTF